jgi:hypothetical protein
MLLAKLGRRRGENAKLCPSPRPACGERSEAKRQRSLRVRGYPLASLSRVPLTRRYAPTSPRKRGEVKNGEACATPNIERAEQSAAIPTATMMRSKIATRYLGWPAGCGQANNKSGND